MCSSTFFGYKFKIKKNLFVKNLQFFGDFQFSLNTNFISEKGKHSSFTKHEYNEWNYSFTSCKTVSGFQHPNQASYQQIGDYENSIESNEQVNVFIILCVVKDSKNFVSTCKRTCNPFNCLLLQGWGRGSSARTNYNTFKDVVPFLHCVS